MGLTYNTYLSAKKIYGCKTCKTHLADHDEIISRVCSTTSPSCNLPCSETTHRTNPILVQNFRGQHGKAYLFNSVVNILSGDADERNMTTGRHVVRDICCKQCKETVGWKYDRAYEQTEKYKEGKFILEQELLCTVN